MAYSRLKCQKCDRDFGQEAKFLDHLTDTHGIIDHKAHYVEVVLHGRVPLCDCGCKEELPWAGWKKGFTSKYVRGHNARIDNVYRDPARQKQFVAKRVEGFKTGRNVAWNVGLTKETDERIRQSSLVISRSLRQGYASGSIVDWHKVDPEKTARASEKQSETKRKKFESGEIITWNKGLNKDTSEVIARIAQKISTRYKSPDAGRRIKTETLRQRIDTFSNKFVLLSSLDEYTSRRIKRLMFKCLTCGTEQAKSLAMLEETPVCFTCHPKESKGQIELYEFVKSLTSDAVLSDRAMLAPKELDVYVPSRKFGIEYNGLYFHSEACDDMGRLDKKTSIARDAGIDILHVFEDEWRDKRQIVEQMITHRLGLSMRKIGARKCSIRELSASMRKEFFDMNHLDGDVRSKISWGLFFGEELVSALSLRTPFHVSHRDVLELARFATTSDTVVSGALSRLSRHALTYAHNRGYRALMTYVDKRVGVGRGYTNAGFQLLRETTPRFWWTDFMNRYDRFSIRADSSKGITQEQAASDAGVVRIWGCSNTVFELVV